MYTYYCFYNNKEKQKYKHLLELEANNIFKVFWKMVVAQFYREISSWAHTNYGHLRARIAFMAIENKEWTEENEEWTSSILTNAIRL